jgi:hypothetical protein
MDEVRQAAGLLAQLGDTADEVAGSLKASGIQGIRNTVRFLNPIVRHLQAQIVGTSEMNLIKGNQLSITLRDGRKVDVPLPLAVMGFLTPFNEGAYADLESHQDCP